jgi:hypothetical protein
MDLIYNEFNRLTDNENDPSAIKELINKTEDLYLECKTIAKEEIDGNLIANKQSVAYFNYGKALSAFANAEGGTIIWGLFAKPRDKNEPDLIVEERPIEKVTKAKTDFDSITGKVVARRIVGVQNKVVYTDKEKDTGFVVTYVPKSDEAPHRVEGEKTGSRRYYRRHGNGSYEMEHYELEEMFGGKTRPKLKVVVLYWFEDTGRNEKKCLIKLGLKNVGMSVAKFSLLEIVDVGQFSKDYYGIDGNGHTGLPMVTGVEGSNKKYQGGASDVIHIDDVIWIDKYSSPYSGNEDDNKRSMKVRIACDGFRIRFVNIQLNISKPSNENNVYEFDSEESEKAS